MAVIPLEIAQQRADGIPEGVVGGKGGLRWQYVQFVCGIHGIFLNRATFGASSNTVNARAVSMQAANMGILSGVDVGDGQNGTSAMLTLLSAG